MNYTEKTLELIDTVCKCRKGSMDDKQYKATVENAIHQAIAEENTAKYHEGYKQGRFDQEMEGNTTNAERIRGHCDKILHDGQSEIDFVHDSQEVILMKTVINTSINRMRCSLAAARLIETPLTGKE